MKGTWAIPAIIIVALAAAPARAGVLYKCIAGDGATSYVSRRVAGASCSAISYPRDAARPRPAAAGPAQPPLASPPLAAAPPVAGREAAARDRLPAAPPPPAQAARADGAGRVVSGQVYAYMKDGVRHYTSARPAQAASLGPVRTIHYRFIERCFACGLTPAVNFGTVRLNTTAFQQEIAAAARQYGVDEAIVRAIIHAESAYNPTALSRAGAQGLMQLMPPTAARFGVTDAYDAAQNIRGGVQYLAWLLDRFNGDLALAAAGYNAGEGAVARHGGVPPYSETRVYVQRVAQLAERYRGALAPVTAVAAAR